MPVVNVLAERQQNLERAQNQQFDVLVIGGGITGLGVAVDAATRGLKVALVERDARALDVDALVLRRRCFTRQRGQVHEFARAFERRAPRVKNGSKA